MSVIKVSKQAQIENGKIRGENTKLFKIYKKKFAAGVINIPFSLSKENPSTSVVLFYTMDPAASSPASCGGVAEIISDPTHEGYAGCKASSKYAGAGWGCDEGF